MLNTNIPSDEIYQSLVLYMSSIEEGADLIVMGVVRSSSDDDLDLVKSNRIA